MSHSPRNQSTTTRRGRCPNCGAKAVVRIVYGYPGAALIERAERGEVMLGGCCLSAHGDPTRGCPDCGWLSDPPASRRRR
jgi:hypothetical protein